MPTINQLVRKPRKAPVTKNLETLANPEALAQFRNRPELAS